MDEIRAFIAIDIPNSLKEKISEIQNRFGELKGSIGFVRVANIHLTLKFLGNISDKQISDIKGVISESTKGILPFTLSATEIGVFPNIRYPRVLWLGLKDDLGRLTPLHKNIEDNMSKLGFQSEGRGFTPHLTLGRIRSLKGKDQLIKLIESERDIKIDEVIPVERVNLMRSQLKPSGAVYSVL
ncbi:MAG: RNA 2',3'-cyclic phosphodiesterase [Nitrospinae bacterium]|nr:RNA 2',3'-cyclic phosphodiesterase [Nitrospinota bacterium]